LDSYLGRLDSLGCVITLTADHGMNSKIALDGTPKVLYLQDCCDTFLGKDVARVILPITDPYVAHHGALGSFATIYLPADADVDSVCRKLASHGGIDLALTRTEAADRFELPADRIGDVVVIGDRATVFGTSGSRHDLRGLDAPLRSHGGVTEQRVPLIVNRPLQGLDRTRRFRNFDAFDLALNYAQ
jgi:phosphonoacetate hydrolase